MCDDINEFLTIKNESLSLLFAFYFLLIHYKKLYTWKKELYIYIYIYISELESM